MIVLRINNMFVYLGLPNIHIYTNQVPYNVTNAVRNRISDIKFSVIEVSFLSFTSGFNKISYYLLTCGKLQYSNTCEGTWSLTRFSRDMQVRTCFPVVDAQNIMQTSKCILMKLLFVI